MQEQGAFPEGTVGAFVIVLALAAIFWLWNRWSVLKVPSVSVGKIMPDKETVASLKNWFSFSFSDEAMGLFISFGLLELALYASGWFPNLFTDEGWLHIVVYSLFLVGATYVVSRETLRAFSRYMLLFAFGIFGFSHVTQERWERAKALWPFGGGLQTSAKVEPSKTKRDPHCPGISPRKPEPFSREWKPFNPEGCDVTFAVTRGTIVLWGPGGEEDVSASSTVVGRRNYSIYTHARAKTERAEMYYMLCPNGKAPENGGWVCNS